MTRYSRTMSESLAEVREGFSPKEIKMAIGVASDKRYAGGNYSGAVKAIEKIKKGLSSHPQVAAVLKRQNEDIQEEPASPDEGNMAVQQLEFMMHAVSRMKGHIAQGGEFPEWMQNKLSGAHEKLKGLYANIEHGDMAEEVELDESSRAKRDAMKAMGRRGVDPADIDEPKASAADQASASKNMISQLRKAKDTRGNFDLEFKDGKKQKIDSKVIDMLLKAHDMIQKPRDKEKFVDMISKSYRDMLNTAKMVSKQLKMGEEITLDEEIKPIQWPSQPLEEGRMKELHGYIDKGMSAQDIAKKMKLDVKTIQALMDETDIEEEVEIDEMKMDDPKLNKIFDKLKKGQTIKLKTSSTISKGKDFVEYIVKSKNTVNKGRVEKVTLVTKGNEGAVKKFLYKRDGKVTFAIGDMGASIDDIKEQEEPQKPDSAKEVEQGREDKKKTRIAQLQLQIAKAQETINKINAQEK